MTHSQASRQDGSGKARRRLGFISSGHAGEFAVSFARDSSLIVL
jgi:hypothetical protein